MLIIIRLLRCYLLELVDEFNTQWGGINAKCFSFTMHVDSKGPLRLKLTLGRTVRDLNHIVGKEISSHCLQQGFHQTRCLMSLSHAESFSSRVLCFFKFPFIVTN